MANVLAELLSTLKEKEHSTIVAVVSVSKGVINNTTLTVEGADTPAELVAKTFPMYDGIIRESRGLAEAAGFPTDGPGLAKQLGGA